MMANNVLCGVDHQILAGIYGTVEQNDRWVKVLDELCARFGARSAVAQLSQEGAAGFQPVWNGRDTRSLADAETHDRFLNNGDNPRLDKTLNWAALQGIGSDQRLFGEDYSLLLQLEKKLDKAGLGRAIWVDFPVSGERHFSLILHRQPGDNRNIDEGEECYLRDLLPHLKQAVSLSSTLAASAARAFALETSIDQVRAGLLLCDSNLNVQWSNLAATELMARTPHLRVTQGQLRSQSASGAVVLNRLVRNASRSPGSTEAAALGQAGEPVIHLRAVKIATNPDNASAQHQNCLALFLSDPTVAFSVDPGELEELFSLTPAEGRLAAALACGASVTEFAEKRGIAVGTARIQLKQILFKTETNRQADLVRQLCSSVAAHTRSH